MKALITGITGFMGSHLAEYLLQEGLEVYGLYRARSKTDNIDHIRDKIKLLNADIEDSVSMRQVLTIVNPDYIFHLASQSWVPQSFQAPSETLHTNIIGTLNILEGVRFSGGSPVIQIAGTSEEYGLVLPSELPITESHSLRPISPYGISKVATDLLAQQYHRTYGLRTVISRCFNTEGPRRGEVFVTSFYAKRIAEILKGKRKPILELGNMEAERDFTDVRDTVRALWLLVNKGQYGEVYNICSGVSRKVMYVVDYLVAKTGLEVDYVVDKGLLRPSDVPRLQGDYSKFNDATGWVPTISFEKTLDDLLEYWLDRV